MPSFVPSPVAAALGLVPTILGGVRALPSKAAQLPIFAISSALNGLASAHQGYDELAERGERLLGRLRGTSVDEIEDPLEQSAQGAPFARPYETQPDAAQADAAQADAAQTDTAFAHNGVPGAVPTQPDHPRVTSAASPDVIATVERVSAAFGGDVVAHKDLPLPDYDHLTLGALRGRMRSLDLAALVQLRDYERATAHRLPIVTMLDNRIAKLASNPTTGTPASPS